MATLTELVVRIGADMSAFEREMSRVTSSINQAGDRLKSFGSTMSMSVTAPIVALGAASLLAFDKQAQALAQVESAVKSTGGAAGFTLDELAAKAQALQETSLFGDEEILKGVTANLLTFSNIAGEAFDRTQQAAIDLSARMGTDLQSSTIQLGKALNDPVANLSALSRAGIQFSEDQKKVIKSMVEGNNLAGAQSVILDELEKQFGGAGAAAAAAGLGPFKQLWNTIGDVSESFGELIADAILPFVDKIRSVVRFVDSLTEEQKKLILTIGGVAAAIGPLAFGFGLLMTAISPVSLAIAGVIAAGAAIILNWDAIVGYIDNTWPSAIRSIQNLWEGLKVAFTVVWDTMKNQFDGWITFFKGAWSAFASFFTGDWSGFWTGIKDIFGGIWQVLTAPFVAASDLIKEGWLRFKVWFLGSIADMLDSVSGFAKFLPGIGDAVEGAATAVRTSMGNAALALSQFKIDQEKTARSVAEENAKIIESQDDVATSAETTTTRVAAAHAAMSKSFVDLTGNIKFETEEQSKAYQELQQVHRDEFLKTAEAIEANAGDIEEDFKDLDKIADEELSSLIDSLEPLHVDNGPLDLVGKKLGQIGKDATSSIGDIKKAFTGEGGLLSAIDGISGGIGGLIGSLGGGEGLGGVVSGLASVAFPGLGVAIGAVSPVLDALGVNVTRIVGNIGNAISGVVSGIFGIGKNARKQAREMEKFVEAFEALGIDPTGDLTSQEEASIRAILTPFRVRGILSAEELLEAVGLSESDIVLGLEDVLENILDPANLAVRAPSATGQLSTLLQDALRGDSALNSVATDFGVDVFDLIDRASEVLGVSVQDAARDLYRRTGIIFGDLGDDFVFDFDPSGSGSGVQDIDDLTGIDPLKGLPSVSDLVGPMPPVNLGSGGSSGSAARTDQTIIINIDGQRMAQVMMPAIEREIEVNVL